jgi:ATP-dependent Clp protease protease subunit
MASPPGIPDRYRAGVPGNGEPRPDDLRSHVYDQLLGRRTVMLDRALDDAAATHLAAQLMALDADGPERIELVVNSPGGPLGAAAAVLDTIGLVRGPVDTTCIGRADGTAAVLVGAGTGRRRVGPGVTIRLRLADVEITGPASRLDDDLARHRDLQGALIDRLVAITRQDRRLIERDVESGRHLTADEAVSYGLADEVAGPDRG